MHNTTISAPPRQRGLTTTYPVCYPITMSNITFHNLEYKDLPTLADMEARSFPLYDPVVDVAGVAHPESWGVREIDAELSQPFTRGLVLRDDKVIVAYYCYLIIPEAFVLRRLLVDPERRRQGLGHLVLDRLYRKMVKSAKRKTLNAFVPHKDLYRPLAIWLAKRGLASKLFSDYFGPGDDAVLFGKHTTEHYDPTVS